MEIGQDGGGGQEVGGIRDCRHFRFACPVPNVHKNSDWTLRIIRVIPTLRNTTLFLSL